MRKLSYNSKTTVKKYASIFLTCTFLILFSQAYTSDLNSETTAMEINGMACYGNVNFSLGSSCETEILPSVLLQSDTITEELYSVMIKDEEGNVVPNATLNATHIGQTFSVSVTRLFGDGNSCWGNLKVEDKSRPSLICNNDTISCNVNIADVNLPEPEDNCGIDKVVLLNLLYHPLPEDPRGLCNPEFVGYYARESQAIDLAGNESEICYDTIFIERVDLDEILFPLDTIIACEVLSDPLNLNEEGFPLPEITGHPTLNDAPIDGPGTLCMADVTYEDIWVFDNGCMKKFKRYWTIHKWLCTLDGTPGYESKKDTQEISIIDSIPPTIEPLADITAYTNADCIAQVFLPKAKVNDNCNDDVIIKIRPEGHDFIIGNTDTFVEYPLGIYTIYYEAMDGNDCGSTIDSLIVTVKDKLEPNVTCREFMVVSLAGGWGSITPDIINKGSYDDCGGKLTYKIKRTVEGCGLQVDTLVDEVYFCCEDAGKTIMVTLVATDESGNEGTCMIMVTVQDKTQPELVCPDDITINCGDTPIYVDATTKGKPTCPSSTFITVALDSTINDCGTGHIERKFTLYNNGVIVDSCSQWITISPGEAFDPNTDIDWPIGSVDVLSTIDDLHDSLSEVTVRFVDCQLAIELTPLLRDSILPDDESFDVGVCDIKIRTFRVEDLCTNDTFYFPQILIFKDTIDPIINIVVPNIPCYSPPLLETSVSISATFSDDVVSYTWVVNLQGGLTIPAMGTSSTNPAVFDAPEGTHSITFTAIDGCNNTAVESLIFDVEICDELCCTETSEFTAFTIVSCQTIPANIDHPDSPTEPQPIASIYNLRDNQNQPKGELWNAPPFVAENWYPDSIGQIFAIAVDTSSNVYFGASDIYDVQQDTAYPDPFIPGIGIHTGRIFKSNPSNAFYAETFVDLPNSGGRLNGIGDVVFDKTYNQFFASNLENGKIYQIDANGTVLDSIDPFVADNGDLGIAPAAEQIWGIGILNKGNDTELFFAIINGGSRKMYSLYLTNGNFAASNLTQLFDIPGDRSVISDIAISKNDTLMIFSERGHQLGVSGDAHDSRAFRYSFDGINWVQDLEYLVGSKPAGNDFDHGKSSAGGVAFGYKSIETIGEGFVIEECDELVWISNNFAKHEHASDENLDTILYGIEGIDVNGNGLDNMETDLFIDFDGVILRNESAVFTPKGQIGDVEVFDCGRQTGFQIANLKGQIKTIDHINVIEANVQLINVNNEVVLENTFVENEGIYDFGDINQSGPLEVVPSKDGDDANGISTLDILFIQRHVLGIDKLKSPYDIIAADVNNDEKVSTADLVQLRKLVLGIINDFPDNTSWRFIDAKHRFDYQNQPWSSPLVESYYIDHIGDDMVVDFTGIKIGDVNGTVFNNVSSRSNNVIELVVPNREVKAGETFDVTFSSQDIQNVFGYQLNLSIQEAEIVSINDDNLTDDNINVTGNGLSISWNSLNALSSSNLLSLKLKANKTTLISDILELDRMDIKPQVYTGNALEISDIKILFKNEEIATSILHQNRPNPFTQGTNIDFYLTQDELVTLKFTDISGRLLKTMSVNGQKGENFITIDKTSDLGISSGTIFYELITNNQNFIRKMLLID